MNTFLKSYYFLLENKVTISYLLFKLLVSLYFLASYVVSHVDQAIYSESYGIKQNDVTLKDASDHKNTVRNESLITSASMSTRSDWPYYWIYFTNWSWTLICSCFWIDTTLVVIRYINEKKHLHYVVGKSKITASEEGINLKL